ncbi:MAG: CDP-diacylglycerol--serine O-phosphatidyltransferase [Elusimicrobia bacterium]|nr:CDP-diacylglycerol--serine O-phosphatidyltransferase [Elusimicrobiota bacterium]
MEDDNKKNSIEKLKKTGMIILPSLFTIANMAFGFFSIIAASNRNFTLAAWFIIAAILMDMLDGRVARLVHSESSFGVEIDSLADWISFGIAPAFLLYAFVIKDYGFWGYPVAFFYTLCGALRLAKYNLKAHFGEEDAKDYFKGLPIPGAAGILASFVLAYSMLEVSGSVRNIKWIMHQMPFLYGAIPFIMIALSLLMLSSVPYGAFKKKNVVKPRSLRKLFFVLTVILLIIAYPQNALFFFFSLYVASGIVLLIFKRISSLRNK